MEYINGKISLGIKYDYGKILKEFNKLKCPKDTFKPPLHLVQEHKYIIEVSERKTGKTTNWLLLGLCMNKLYGTVVQYIRTKETMLSPSYATELVSVINSYNNGQYIYALTDGRWNCLYYHWKKFYYGKRDEEGTLIEKSETHCIQMLSIDKNFDYKSSYNAPTGDIIILDEFIGKNYAFNEAIDFFDLCDTIIRNRQSPFIVMLANTINRHSPYFEELCISKQIMKAVEGEPLSITTDLGTRISFEILKPKSDTEKVLHNSLFFGFNNPKLSAITGGCTWAYEAVQHIPKEGYTIINKSLYIRLSTLELLQCEIAVHENEMLCMHIHRATKTYADSIILTLDVSELDNQHLYGTGNAKIHNLIYKLLAMRRIFFSTNEVGADFKNYLRLAKQNPYSIA